MVNEQGQEMTVRGESLGGGKVRIVEINHVKVDFTGEYSAIIVIHQDTPGVVAYITRCLSERNKMCIRDRSVSISQVIACSLRTEEKSFSLHHLRISFSPNSLFLVLCRLTVSSNDRSK